MQDVVMKIRKGEIDVNNHELFFSTLLKGLLYNLNEQITIRKISVPHMIIHTGSDVMYLEVKGYDNSIEPMQASNENYIYNITPRCIVKPDGIDIITDQLTNPYSMGKIQYEGEENIYELVAEFRRMPIKMDVNLQYVTDTFRDMLELIQQIITKLTFIKTFDITYLGQSIKCSYSIPESFSEEHLMDIDGMTTDSKSHTLELSIELETNIPVYNTRTVMDSGEIASKYAVNDKLLGKRYDINPFYNQNEDQLLGKITDMDNKDYLNLTSIDDIPNRKPNTTECNLSNDYNTSRKHGIIIRNKDEINQRHIETGGS